MTGGGRHRAVTALAAAVGVVMIAAGTPGLSAPAEAEGGGDLTRYVNTFAGTAGGQPDFGTGGGAGNTYPGAVVPFGMVQWSPDTTPSTTNVGGGYSYEDRKIDGFSLTHMSGAGCAGYGDIPFLPTTRPIRASPISTGTSDFRPEYVATFDHRAEAAHPGYYAVTLNPGRASAIRTELSATTRTGAGRFTFPARRRGSVLINVGGSAMADTLADVRIDPRRHEVGGSARSGAFCYNGDRYRLYFSARFSRPFVRYGTWRRDVLSPGATHSSDVGIDPRLRYHSVPGGPTQLPGDPSGTAQAGAFVSFGTHESRVVRVRVGVSFVSVADARANLRAENPRGDFSGVSRRAHAAWNAALHKVTVRGGRPADRSTFYTMLYHALLHPNVFSDVSGRYRGMDGRVHRAGGHVKYADFSGWDVYRSQIPLLAMLDPHRAADISWSLLADQRQSGWLPKWPVANGQTAVMAGDPADPAIAATYAFGARGFDARAALSAMVHGATTTGRSRNAGYVERPGTSEYQRLGYIPIEEEAGVLATVVDPSLVWGPTSTTLEYALADFSIARFADAVCGRRPVAGCGRTIRKFTRRSGYWRNVFNPQTRYVESRTATGLFEPNHDPTDSRGFVEGDGAQYTWLVPQDPAGLFAALGGRHAARERLDHFFRRLNAGPTSPHAFLGNEPTLGTPYLYDWLGQPWKAQRVVRRSALGLYSATPGGYPGNDDLGEMSSWYVFAALGLYPAVPGEDILAMSSPLFPRAELRLPRGTVTIVAPDASRRAQYIRSVAINGHAYSRPWLRFRRISPGATVHVELQATPTRWGSQPDQAPPSYPAGR